MNNEILTFWKLLKKSKKILLINHIRMDPDAFWALAWFYNLLKNIWWFTIKATNDEKTPDDFLKPYDGMS
jgi:nanoRNase/pAp phosphatase (c-di-AMP/oligoRNAs hydrolase)